MVQYGSLLGGFPLSPVPGTPPRWYHYQNMTCKLYWSLIGWRKSSLLCHWTCDMRPNIDLLDFNPHSQQKIGWNFCLNKRTFLYQPKNSCFVVCWGSTDVPLVDSRGADPARAEWKSLVHTFCTLYIFRVFSVYIFTFCNCVLLKLKSIWSNKCTSRLYQKCIIVWARNEPLEKDKWLMPWL